MLDAYASPSHLCNNESTLILSPPYLPMTDLFASLPHPIKKKQMKKIKKQQQQKSSLSMNYFYVQIHFLMFTPPPPPCTLPV